MSSSTVHNDREPGRANRLSVVVRHPVMRVVGRRLAAAIPLLFVVSALSFVLVSLTPGDPARTILGANATPGALDKMEHALGLDLPVYEQYGRWVVHAVQGDLGRSLYTNEPVTSAIANRLPVTLWLVFWSLLLTVVIGVSLGIFSAVRGGFAGRVVDVLAMVGFAVPPFWLGALLISIFAVKLGVFPSTGYVPFAESPGHWFLSLALPVTTLAVGCIAQTSMQTRQSMLDALGSEHVRMTRANGISERSIVFRHALKNAAIPVVTVLGLQAVGTIGAAVIVEVLCGIPGIGSLAESAATQQDLPLIQGVVVYVTVIVVIINLLVDLMYTALNPRVRTH